MSSMGPSRLTVHSRPSSWGSATDECRTPSDSGSPSCFTLSTVSGDPMSAVTSGTLPFAFSDSPVSPEASTTSSLARLAWKPLDVSKNRNEEYFGSGIQHSRLPPVPQFPQHLAAGTTTQRVKVETRTITYAHSIRSEHPNILDTPTSSDVEPLPKTFYVPPTPIQNSRQYPIGTAIGSSSQSSQLAMRDTLHTDIIPGKTVPAKFSETLHTDIIPGKTVPPKLPEVESPAAESFYQNSNAPTEVSGSSTPQTQATAISAPHTQGTVDSTSLTQPTTQYDSPGLRFGFSPQSATTPRAGSAMGSPPQPIHIRSPPRGINEEWHPPPQTPTRSLSLSVRPMPQMPTLMNQVQSGHSSTQSQTPSHTRSDSTSSTTGLISAPGRTRSFSGNRPSPFKLNPGNQVFPGPPGSNTSNLHRVPTSKFSDDGDGDDGDNGGSDLAKKEWIVHFTTPVTLSLLFFCGLMSAALHHIFYGQLHGTAPSREFQQWHTRAGITISVFTVACWVGCVAICYKQRVWSTLAEKNVKVSGIDALWGLIQNPSLFLVGEAWRKSKVAMGLGIIMWILPLTTIFAPGALTIRPSTHGSSQACLVPTFTPPSTSQSLMPAAEMDRLLQQKSPKDLPLTSVRSGNIVLTSAVKRIGSTTAISGRIPDFPLPEGCGNQGNCSYTASFTAPGYKCDVVTADEARKNGPWGPVGFDKLFVPANGEMVFYSAKADNRTKSPASQSRTTTGIRTQDEKLGFGTFWVAVRSLGEEYTNADPSLLLDPTKAKNEMYQDQVFQCSDYVVAYENVKFSYFDGHMDVQLSNAGDRGIRYIAPVDYTQYSKNNGTDVTDAAIFSRVAHDFTYTIIDGEFEVANSTISSSSQILGTELVDGSRLFGAGDNTGIPDKVAFPRADIKSKLEELHRNVTFSFLSEPRLKGTFYTPTTCATTTNGLVYKYRSFALLMAYGLACFFTTIAIVVGIISLRANGFATDFSFSRILCTTRNQNLDGITRGESCLGAATERVRRQELRFGEIWIKGSKKNREKRGLDVVREEDDFDVEEGSYTRYGARVGHAAFGVPSQVTSLRKGRGYA